MSHSRSLLLPITSRSFTTWLLVLSKRIRPTFAIRKLKKWKNTEMQWKTLLLEIEVLKKISNCSKWWDKEEWKKVNVASELKWTCNTLTQTWEISSLTESDSLAIHILETNGVSIQLTITLIASLILLKILLILYVPLNLKSEEKVTISFLSISIFTSQTFGNILDLTFQTLLCLRERFKLSLKKVLFKAGTIQDFLLWKDLDAEDILHPWSMLSVMKLVFLEKVTKTLLLSNFLSNSLEKNLMPKLQELSVFKMHFILKSKILIKLKRQN